MLIMTMLKTILFTNISASDTINNTNINVHKAIQVKAYKYC